MESFGELQKTLSLIEDTLQDARRYYNAVVRDFNTAIEPFPSNLVAAVFGFIRTDFFEIGAAEREAPSVDLDPDTY